MSDEQDFLDRRSSMRLDMEKELISIVWQDQQGQPQSRDVMCVDVSNGGLKFSLEQSIAIDTPVQVFFKPRQTLTTLRHATVIRVQQQPHGWFDIGLIFSND